MSSVTVECLCREGQSERAIEEWQTLPIKRLATGPGSLFIDGDWIESKDLALEGIRYLTTGNVGDGFYKEQGTGFISAEKFKELRCTEVFPGDILIARLNDPIGRACIVPDLRRRIVTAVDNVILRPGPNFDRRFLVYRFSSKDYAHLTKGMGSGATMQRVARSELGNLRLSFPPLQEQIYIADFLDRETSRIDTLITKKTRFIELLKEKRQAVITKAVTKGLDDSVKMKDSGVEWIGEVPEYWEIKQLRHLGCFRKGLSITKADLLDDGVPCLNYGEVHSRYPFEVNQDFQPLRKVSEGYLASHPEARVAQGDFVFADTSEDFKGVGNFTLISGKQPLFAGYHTIIYKVTVNTTVPRFLAYYFESFAFRTQLRMLVKGVKVFSITQEILRGANIWLPPTLEQNIIADFLDRETSRIDILLSKTERSIELLKEKRSALITAAVTGKIDVREAA